MSSDKPLSDHNHLSLWFACCSAVVACRCDWVYGDDVAKCFAEDDPDNPITCPECLKFQADVAALEVPDDYEVDVDDTDRFK